MTALLKKFTLSVAIFCLGHQFTNAQSNVPQFINYQGVARNSKGDPLSKKEVFIKLSFIANNVVEYYETRLVSTNEFGLFTFKIGDGTANTSSAKDGKPFSSIDWSIPQKTIQLSISPDMGNSYIESSTITVSSVPYALYSRFAESANDISNKVNSLKNPSNFTVPTTEAVVEHIKDITGINSKNIIFADGTVPMKGDLNVNNNQIKNVITPTDPNDAANKAYVDEAVKDNATEAVANALNNNTAPTDKDKNLQDAVKNFMKKNGDDITQNDQLNNFITLNQGTSAIGATLLPVEIGFDKNSFNKAAATEVLAKDYDHDNNDQTPKENPLMAAINSLNPWKNKENKVAAQVLFSTNSTNFTGKQSNLGLEVSPNLTVKIGNFINAGKLDNTQTSYHTSTDDNGVLSVFQGQIEPVRVATNNTTLGLSDYLIYANGAITITLPNSKETGRVNGRIYVISAVGGTITLNEGYKSVADFGGNKVTTVTKGNTLKIIYINSENAWVEAQ